MPVVESVASGLAVGFRVGEFVDLGGESQLRRERERETYKGDGLDEIACDFSDDFKIIILVEHSSLPPGCAHSCCAHSCCSTAATCFSFALAPGDSDGPHGQPKAHVFIAFGVATVRYKCRDLVL